MRVIVTGSRDWKNDMTIYAAMSEIRNLDAGHGELITLVSGACPTGADNFAEGWARRWSWEIERYPADWKGHGRSAGPFRNKRMVRLGADVCLAFLRNNSKGTQGMIDLCKAAGIPVRLWTEE
jgi:YspA, cpYpsA-related SLOG family